MRESWLGWLVLALLLVNLLLVLCIGTAVLTSFRYLGIDLGELGASGNLKQMAAYVQRAIDPTQAPSYGVPGDE